MLPHICSGYGIGALHFWEMFLQSTPNISSIPSTGFGQAFSEFQEYLQWDDPLAPAEPEQHWPLLEEGYSPSESPKTVPPHFQCSRGTNSMEFPKIMDIALGVRCHSCKHGEHEEVSWLLQFDTRGPGIQVLRSEPLSVEGSGHQRSDISHHDPHIRWGSHTL